MAKHTAKWRPRPQQDDLRAALQYLTLLFPDKLAQELIRKARSGTCVEYVAKDLLRACRLPLMSPEERHVAEDIKRIRKGKRLSPIILVQGDLTQGRPLVIADGYRRMCAACHADEDAPVSAAIVRP